MIDIQQTIRTAEPDSLRPANIVPAVASTAIQVADVGRRDPKSDRWLIQNIWIDLNFGDRLGIVGPSGAGKTVLMRAIAMLDPIDAGSIQWKGRVVHGDAVPLYRKQVVYLHQRSALWEGSVEENLRFPYSLKIRSGEQFNRARALELLNGLGRTPEFLSKSSRDLSGGESQIVALVRALQLEPSVLLLDEPTASLDLETALAAETLLSQWLDARREERALVWVGHDLKQTLRMSDRRLAMRTGRMVAEPEPANG